MVPLAPSGWVQRFSADLVVYETPDGAGRIRCYQRAPLESLSRSIARVSGEHRVDATRPMITGEGEYAAICDVTQFVEGDEARRVVAVLFADYHSVVIEGPHEHSAIVFELIVAWRLALGARPRRFFYRPPSGWRGMPNGLATTWLPAAFPREQQHVVVYPATPTAEDPQDELARLLANELARDGAVPGVFGDVRVELTNGLVGRRWSLRFDVGQQSLYREIAYLQFANYRYAIKLESSFAPRLEILDAMVHSIRPVPMGGRRVWFGEAVQALAGAHEHWMD